MEKSYEIRTMRREELDIATEWAALEGWNPGLHDAEAFYAADPSGFFVGLLDGEPIASISAVAYDTAFAFIGFYIVKPEHRGQGYGLQIWNHAMQYVNGRNAGLDGVLAQQANYERSGFKLAYRNVRYEGRSGRLESDSSGVVPLSDLDMDDVLAYDRRHFPALRTAFLENWLRMPDSAVVGLVRGRELQGYGVVRRCRHGYKIGPLFAEDVTLAETLFAALTSPIETDAPVFLDVPEVNTAAVQLAQRHAMTPVFETVRMYTHAPPVIALDHVFGVTSFELG